MKKLKFLMVFLISGILSANPIAYKKIAQWDKIKNQLISMVNLSPKKLHEKLAQLETAKNQLISIGKMKPRKAREELLKYEFTITPRKAREKLAQLEGAKKRLKSIENFQQTYENLALKLGSIKNEVISTRILTSRGLRDKLTQLEEVIKKRLAPLYPLIARQKISLLNKAKVALKRIAKVKKTRKKVMQAWKEKERRWVLSSVGKRRKKAQLAAIKNDKVALLDYVKNILIFVADFIPQSAREKSAQLEPVKKILIRIANLPPQLLHEYAYRIVKKVVDGDTIELESGERVRLIGIDTPEVHKSKKLYRDSRRLGIAVKTIRLMGKKASDFTRELLKGKRVRLEFDVQKRDKYGRFLAYVYLPDGTFVNAKIVEEGYASPSTYPPNVKYASHFLMLYKKAREKRKGLWGGK